MLRQPASSSTTRTRFSRASVSLTFSGTEPARFQDFAHAYFQRRGASQGPADQVTELRSVKVFLAQEGERAIFGQDTDCQFHGGEAGQKDRLAARVQPPDCFQDPQAIEIMVVAPGQ